ncbi:MAG TPA: DUF4256 domain-containing protein [Ignavibacteria bacterium]|nr:DUF4256 domain-containing protein [Ignavibacteria bacterium]
MKKKISKDDEEKLISVLKERFEKNMRRHKGIKWEDIEKRLKKFPKKLTVLNKMEKTGGEPDVINVDKKTGEVVFCDCSKESPSGRRSLCYDREALDSRKENKPKGNAEERAKEIGIEILNELEYVIFQSTGSYDTKTSSWLKTDEEVRNLGGAIFGDCRFGRVFIYHNGAESYYAARGFRGKVII